MRRILRHLDKKLCYSPCFLVLFESGCGPRQNVAVPSIGQHKSALSNPGLSALTLAYFVEVKPRCTFKVIRVCVRCGNDGHILPFNHEHQPSGLVDQLPQLLNKEFVLACVGASLRLVFEGVDCVVKTLEPPLSCHRLLFNVAYVAECVSDLLLSFRIDMDRIFHAFFVSSKPDSLASSSRN